MIEEVRIWLPIARDAVVALAAAVTALAAVAGLRTWKRELAGRERFNAAKELVTCSHRLWRACNRLRMEVGPNEERHFDSKEVEVTTSRERWVLSECEVYSKRIQAVQMESDQYNSALLSARVVLGSWVYEAFLPFGQKVTESVNLVNDYLSLIRDEDQLVTPDSPIAVTLKERVALPLPTEDELSEQLADAREAGERKMLCFLDRSTIQR